MFTVLTEEAARPTADQLREVMLSMRMEDLLKLGRAGGPDEAGVLLLSEALHFLRLVLLPALERSLIQTADRPRR